MTKRSDLVIEEVRATHEDRASRVEAEVDGVPVWFASEDATLAPRIEAFAGPFLLAALAQGRRLVVADAPDVAWLEGARRAVPLLRSWWGWRGPDPLAGIVAAPDVRPARAEGSQCFTGGLDSFFTLFRSPHRRDALVYVHGYDIDLGDAVRMAAFEPSLREVARATGRRAIVLRTNLREHPTFRRVPWVRSHGAALAAAGHVLSDTLGSLVIPASWSRAYTKGWGSRWDLDPLWSSAPMRIVHDDASLERWDKPPHILHEDLMFRHLRVCWENRTPTGNCGECEKCVRTRLVFLRWGRFQDLEPMFQTRLSLIEAVDALPALDERQLDEVWRPYYVPWPVAPDVHAATVRLVERSERDHRAHPLRRLRRRVTRALGRLVRGRQ